MNHAQIVADLKAAKALIDTPEKWTTHQYARDEEGNSVSFWAWDEVTPTCYCSIGAIAKVQGGITKAEAGTAVRLLDAAAFGPAANSCAIAYYNDSHTHEEVMAVWDKAIAKAEALAVVDNLVAARAKIEKPEQWTQQVAARNAQGQEDNVDSTDAVCFCTFGAIVAVAGMKYGEALKFCTDAVGRNAVDFNDASGRKHEEVLTMFDKAIELAKEAANAV